MIDHRQLFEERISHSPYEKSIERLPETCAWPGQYKDINVQLAWDVLCDVIVAIHEKQFPEE